MLVYRHEPAATLPRRLEDPGQRSRIRLAPLVPCRACREHGRSVRLAWPSLTGIGIVTIGKMVVRNGRYPPPHGLDSPLRRYGTNIARHERPACRGPGGRERDARFERGQRRRASHGRCWPCTGRQDDPDPGRRCDPREVGKRAGLAGARGSPDGPCTGAQRSPCPRRPGALPSSDAGTREDHRDRRSGLPSSDTAACLAASLLATFTVVVAHS
jgi:hypothetical protein